jgi:CRP/FNR family transcriptional regulator, cyclic AMP receptor protein
MDIIDTFFLQYPVTTYKKGDVILQPEDNTSFVSYIKSGFVRVYQITKEGDEKFHVIYKQGEIFPLLWVLNTVPVTKYYEAIDKAEIIKVPIKEFKRLLDDNKAAYKDLSKRLTTMVVIFAHRVESLVQTKAANRVIAHILDLVKRFNKPTKEGLFIELPLTPKDIAHALALTRETVSKEFEKLVEKQIISYKERHLLVKDLQKLENELKE